MRALSFWMIAGFSSFSIHGVCAADAPSLRGSRMVDGGTVLPSVRIPIKRKLNGRKSMKSATNKLMLGELARSGRLLRENNASATYDGPTCVANLSSLPSSWMPSDYMENVLSNITKPTNITAAVEQAARGAFWELVDFMKRPGIVEEFGDKWFGTYHQRHFAGTNMPEHVSTSPPCPDGSSYFSFMGGPDGR